MLSKKQLFTKGMIDISPHMLSVIPFGIICGAIGVELGFSPYLVYAMSFIIFGGASQIVFLQVLSGGASSLVAVTSVGIINSRHLLYGAVLSEYLEKLSLIKKLLISYLVVDQGQIVFLQVLSGGASSLVAVTSVGIINSRHLLYGAVLSEYLEKLSLIKKLLISYLVVDQGFAESNKFFKKNKNEQHLHYHLIGTGCTMWVCWQISTLSGIILGSFVPEELGLKFTIPLTFIAIVVQDLKKIDHLIVMITCGLSSLLFFDAPFKSYIIIAPVIALFVASLITRLKK